MEILPPKPAYAMEEFLTEYKNEVGSYSLEDLMREEERCRILMKAASNLMLFDKAEYYDKCLRFVSLQVLFKTINEN